MPPLAFHFNNLEITIYEVINRLFLWYNIVLGNVTNDLVDKLIRIRRYIAKSRNGRGGIVHYKSNITQVIGEIINDLSIASGRRRGIVSGIEGIKSEGYHQKR